MVHKRESVSGYSFSNSKGETRRRANRESGYKNTNLSGLSIAMPNEANDTKITRGNPLNQCFFSPLFVFLANKE